MRDRKGTFLTLTPDAAQVLSGVENKSAFVSLLVTETRRRALSALRWLERQGKDGPPLAAACRAIKEGFGWGDPLRHQALRAELRLYNDVAGEHGIEPAAWQEWVGRLEGDEIDALLAVADQVAAGDSEIEKRIKREEV